MKRKYPHTVQKSSVGCFRTDPQKVLLSRDLQSWDVASAV